MAATTLQTHSARANAERIFTSIPPHNHDVVPLRGLVAVYETNTLFREETQDGQFYVIERQRPSGWGSQMQTSREVVQARRCTKRPGEWWLHHADFRDGPIHDYAVAEKFVGKVVGIYRPTSN